MSWSPSPGASWSIWGSCHYHQAAQEERGSAWYPAPHSAAVSPNQWLWWLCFRGWNWHMCSSWLMNPPCRWNHLRPGRLMSSHLHFWCCHRRMRIRTCGHLHRSLRRMNPPHCLSWSSREWSPRCSCCICSSPSSRHRSHYKPGIPRHWGRIPSGRECPWCMSHPSAAGNSHPHSSDSPWSRCQCRTHMFHGTSCSCSYPRRSPCCRHSPCHWSCCWCRKSDTCHWSWISLSGTRTLHHWSPHPGRRSCKHRRSGSPLQQCTHMSVYSHRRWIWEDTVYYSPNRMCFFQCSIWNYSRSRSPHFAIPLLGGTQCTHPSAAHGSVCTRNCPSLFLNLCHMISRRPHPASWRNCYRCTRILHGHHWPWWSWRGIAQPCHMCYSWSCTVARPSRCRCCLWGRPKRGTPYRPRWPWGCRSGTHTCCRWIPSWCHSDSRRLCPVWWTRRCTRRCCWWAPRSGHTGADGRTPRWLWQCLWCRRSGCHRITSWTSTPAHRFH